VVKVPQAAIQMPQATTFQKNDTNDNFSLFICGRFEWMNEKMDK
jgi:hypothetical protein